MGKYSIIDTPKIYSTGLGLMQESIKGLTELCVGVVRVCVTRIILCDLRLHHMHRFPQPKPCVCIFTP